MRQWRRRHNNSVYSIYSVSDNGDIEANKEAAANTGRKRLREKSSSDSVVSLPSTARKKRGRKALNPAHEEQFTGAKLRERAPTRGGPLTRGG
jgi:hypothetical protein